MAEDYGMPDGFGRSKKLNRLRTIEAPTREPDAMRATLGASGMRSLEASSKSISGCMRRYIEPKPSKEAVFRPHRKPLGPTHHDDRPTGLRSVKEPVRVQKSPGGGRRHFADGDKQTVGDGRPQLGNKIRVRRDDGTLACERQAHEDQLEVLMGSKKRLDPTDTSFVRNGIGVSRPGDKLYSFPEYAPGFFKRHGDVPDGTVPGANWGTFKLLDKFDDTEAAKLSRQATGKLNKAPTLWAVGKPPVRSFDDVPTHLSYDKIRAAELLEKELREVETLHTEWEERTGMHMYEKKAKKPETEEGDNA